jgi:hypothetical protein
MSSFSIPVKDAIQVAGELGLNISGSIEYYAQVVPTNY